MILSLPSRSISGESRRAGGRSRLILAPAKPIEKELRSLTTDDPKAQEELDYIAYVWGHRLLPRF